MSILNDDLLDRIFQILKPRLENKISTMEQQLKQKDPALYQKTIKISNNAFLIKTFAILLGIILLTIIFYFSK
ncbi:hypothetical protein A2634_00105 [Candidatus Amesbacteria bacterium RIFCSPHIGHO2_01_FULL_48_32]|uniref:Uncharacterized protein n=1 Tax=Candidatus Amesbacteria bacterium RIFCSPLOWO2_01_FULL_48_25 TaxID=1797259 RepID=A0A1F4ZAN8_9BACT|nr:MAG: hypothetical protein A2634_00105 [Candidatus Amesbacteria bacterium RIFCSPHIGHO2_01_FULL_48_32]OGD03211.1 MAG: hypothetical protein A2989_00055 [Candidatus Amesbacteria bacterium RIFCSPLOWO2_01_FULL_48_25]HJZ05536.1 hypothetical protein [Patescibacteria group bacterium]